MCVAYRFFPIYNALYAVWPRSCTVGAFQAPRVGVKVGVPHGQANFRPRQVPRPDHNGLTS